MCIPPDLHKQIAEKKELCDRKGFKSELGVFENKNNFERSQVKFVITLGGDGTIIWASKQFNGNYFPPLVSFALGSLGFLANFEFEEYKVVISAIL